MTPPPLGPGRLRIAATYRAYRRHGRFAATAADATGTSTDGSPAPCATVDGQRWMNVHVPGTRRARRAAGITVQVDRGARRRGQSTARRLGLFIAGRDGTTQVATLAALVVVAVLVEATVAHPVLAAAPTLRASHRHDRSGARSSPPWPRTPDADIGSTSSRSSATWCPGSTPTTWPCASKPDPELVPVYERFLSTAPGRHASRPCSSDRDADDPRAASPPPTT